MNGRASRHLLLLVISAPFGGFEEINCLQEGATLKVASIIGSGSPFPTQPLMTMAGICRDDKVVFFTTVARKEQRLFSCVRFNLLVPDLTLSGCCVNKTDVSEVCDSAVFVLCCSLGNRDNSVICILFYPRSPVKV